MGRSPSGTTLIEYTTYARNRTLSHSATYRPPLSRSLGHTRPNWYQIRPSIYLIQCYWVVYYNNMWTHFIIASFTYITQYITLMNTAYWYLIICYIYFHIHIHSCSMRKPLHGVFVYTFCFFAISCHLQLLFHSSKDVFFVHADHAYCVLVYLLKPALVRSNMYVFIKYHPPIT